MTDKQLRKLSRSDLLELLLVQTKENERLRAELAQAEAQLADRRLRVEEAGSIAKASLVLNGVMEAAQAAADQYLENIAQMKEEAEQMRREAEQLLQAAREAAEQGSITAHFDAEDGKYLKEVSI